MKRQASHSIDVVFVLALFCTFAMTVLMTLMLGTSAYNRVTDIMNQNYEDRTATGYITEKLRHCDSNGGIKAGQLDGRDALMLSRDIDGELYTTYIYYNDGYICELFTEADNQMSADAGEQIIRAAGLKVEQTEGGLLKITCTMHDGSKPYLLISPRTTAGVSMT